MHLRKYYCLWFLSRLLNDALGMHPLQEKVLRISCTFEKQIKNETVAFGICAHGVERHYARALELLPS
jgi:hypothetical protein